MTISPAKELEKLTRSRAHILREAILSVVRAEHSGFGMEDARAKLAETVEQLKVLANLTSRKRVLMHSDKMTAQAKAGENDLIPAVPFKEAIRSLVEREPRLVPPHIRELGTQEMAEYVGDLYAGQGFTLSEATSTAAVQKAKTIIADSIAGGGSRISAVALLEKLGPFSQARARTIFQNNVVTAYADGALAQMRDPAVQAVIPALMFSAIGGKKGDGSTTAICRAFDGTVAPADHSIWNERTPICHHGCRSSLDMVSWSMARQMGLVRDGVLMARIPNPSVKPMPGFGRRAA